MIAWPEVSLIKFSTSYRSHVTTFTDDFEQIAFSWPIRTYCDFSYLWDYSNSESGSAK